MWKWFKRMFLGRHITPEEIDVKIKEALGVKWLQSIQKLKVKDGDVLIILHPGILSTGARKYLQEIVQNIIKEYGYNVHVMLLEEGMHLGLLRKEN